MLPELLSMLRGRRKATGPDGADTAPADAPRRRARAGEPDAQVPEEIEALLEQVRLAYEQQSRLIRGIGHDFKSPLASILRSSEALAAGDFGPMDPDQAETCRLIAESARHLMAIAQALYAVGGAREDGHAFQHAEVDVLEATSRTVDAYRSAARAKEIGLTLSLPDEGPMPVCAAQGAVERVIGNVLHNAVKFTFDGAVTVTCTRVAGAALIVIEDTGIGIPPEELASIGTEFMRATNAGEISGSGVGLAVAKHLLTGMGGTLSVTSAVGEGSRFEIQLPLASAACEERG